MEKNYSPFVPIFSILKINPFFFSLLIILSFHNAYSQDCSQRTLSSDVSICNSQTASIILSNSETSMSYQLRNGTTNVGTAQIGNGGDLTFTVSPSSTTTYNVIATSTTATPCTINYTDTATVTVTPTVIPSVLISVSPGNSICENTSVTFTANPSNGGSSPTYQWKLNGANIGTNSPTYTTSTLVNTDKVTVVLTSNATCPSPTSVTSNQITMTVNDIVTPSATISASATTICPGTNVTFSANAINGGTAPTYQWKINGVNAGSNSSSFSTSALNNGDTVTVDMTSNAVCPSATTISSNSVTMTVNPNLPVSVNINASANNICPGTNVTFTATPTNGGSAPSYQWKVNGSNAGGDSNVFSSSSLTNGSVVSVVLTSNAVCPTGNPSTSNNITMTVNPNLPVSVSINASANNICAGTNVTFTATPANGGTSPSYQWKINGSNVGTNSSTFSSSSLANGDVVSVVLTSNASPCATGSPATSNNITMTVNPNLPVSVSISASASTICPGTNVTFTATPTNGGSTPSYQWKLNGGNTGTNSNTFSSSTLVNGDMVSVVLTSNANCIAGNPATSNNITMSVNPNLPVSVSINASANNICSGTNVTFTSTPINGGTSPSYQWKVNGGNVGTNSSTFSSSSLANGDVVSVVLTSNATCPTGNPATSTGITMTVNPNVPVSVSINATSTNICAGSNVTFTATPTNGGASPSYQWKVNGSNVGTNSSTFSSSSLANGDVVSVVLTSNAVCTTGSPATSNSITMTVNPLITPSVSITSSSTSICSSSGTEVNFTATPVNGGTTPSYQWKNNGTNIGGATSSTYKTNSLAAGSNITVTMTSNATCASPSSVSSNSIAMTSYTGNPSNWTGNPITLSSPSVCPPATITISTTQIPNAQYYTWTLPAGFTITSGAGTSNITASVNSGATVGNNQTISVQAFNPCGNNNSKTDKINVNNFNGVTVNQTTQTVCSNGSISVIGTLTGNAASGTWSAPSGNFSNIVTSGTNPITVSATYTPSISSGNVTLTITTNAPSGGGCPNTPGTATVNVTVNQIVDITTQPTATQTVCSGSNVSFNVVASGTGLTYQWRKGATNLVNGGNVSGANSATLTLTGALTSDAGSYNVVVSGISPCTSVTSSSATLNVNQIVTITTQPAASQTKCSGSSASFSVVATGTGLTYQWRKGTTNLTNGGTISGANTATLTISSVISTDTASDYNVVITGTSPCNSVTSSNASLFVNDAVVITSQPNPSQTLCSTSSASFSVAATGTGLTYQWKKNGTNLNNGGSISGATSNNLTISNISTSDTANYTVIVNGIAPCTSATSNIATLTINQIIDITTQPATTQTKCSGTSVSFSVAATGTGLTYQWRKGTTNLSNGGTISGANSATLTINPISSADTASDYNVVISGTSPCSPLNSNNAALVVNDAVTITLQPNPSQTLCSGSTASFSISATGTGLTYQWKKGSAILNNGGSISGATSANLTISNTSVTDSDNYTVVISGSSPCTSATSNVATLTVNQIVAITTQPTTTQTKCSGSTTSFSVAATGSGLTYQWRKGTTNLTNGGSISGVNSATLTINPVTSGDTASDYNVVITGTSPCTPLTSNNASLVVNDAVVITSQPNPSQTLCSGSTASFSVTASGTGLTYQWKKNGTYLSNGGSISGATSNNLIISNITTADADNYTVIVSGTSPCSAVTSSVANLVVKKPVVITNQPANTSVCASFPASMSIVATGDNLTYQWYKGIPPGTAVSNTAFISGSQSATLNFSQASLSDDGIYYVIVSGHISCPSATSAQRTLNIDQSITVITQPQSKSLCTGSNVTFTVAADANGETLSYQWRKNGSNINGQTSTSLSLTNITSGDAANYDVLISGPSGYQCSSAQSNTAVLTVNPLPTISGTLTVCSDSTSQLTGSTTAATSNPWTSSNPSIATINNSGLLTGITAGTSLITYIDNNGCQNSATITVNTTPNATATPTSQTICSNTALATIALSGSLSGTNFNWTRDNMATITGLSSSGSGDISGTLINATFSPATVTFTITPIANGCNGTPINATVLVNPTPNATATPSTQTICSANAITTIALSGNVSGTTFNWTRDNLTNVTGIVSSGNGNISGTLTNTTSAPTSTIFSIIPLANGCNGTQINAAVLVNPTPNVTATPGSQTICSANTITPITLSGNVPGTTFSWTRDNTSSTTGINSSGSGNISGNLTNTSTAPVTTNFSITPLANGCNGTPINVTLLVNPTPNATATPSSQNICSANTITPIALSGNVSGTTFSWTRDNTSSITGINSSGNGNISGTLTNTTSAPTSTIFSITPLANGCNGTPINATVLVNPTPNATATPVSQTICSANTITPIALSGNVPGTTFNWTRDNTSSTTGINSSGSGNISGNLTNLTNASITVTFTITPTANSCPGVPITPTVFVNAATVAGAVTISQPGVTPVVTYTTECHSANGTLYLNGNIGNVIRWESSTNGGNNWTSISNTASTYNYSNITASTLFRAVIQNGSVCSEVSSSTSLINVIPNLKPDPVIATPATICAGQSSVLTSGSSYASSQGLATGGNFNNSNPSGWKVDGCGNCLNAGASNTNPGPFQLSASNGGTYSGTSYTSSGKFVIANGNFNSILETPTFNTYGLSTATFNFKHSYNLAASASIKVELSTDGGTSYNIILMQVNGPTTLTPYNLSTSANIDLSPYLGQGNLKIRFVYQGKNGSSWAIDDIAIPDVPTNATTQWKDSTSGQIISNTSTVTVTPTVTTTYYVISSINGCDSFGTNGTASITVTVNPTPDVIASQNSQTICSATSITPINLSGAVNGTVFSWTRDNTSTIMGIAASGSGNISGNLTNSTTSPATTTFTITPTANGCVGIPISIPVLINPTPNLSINPASQTICSESNITSINLSGNVSGTAFDWIRNNTSVSGISTNGSGNITGSLTNTSGSPASVTFNITPTANGCSGSTLNATIIVNPLPTSNISPNSQTICNSGTATLTVNLSGIGPWSFTYNNGSALQTINNITTTPYSFSVPGITANKTFTLTALNDANCPAKPLGLSGSALITVLNGTAGLWTGLISTDWFDCLNWGGGLPSPIIDVTIPASATRMPIIDPANSIFAASYGNIAYAKNVIIEAGASLTMGSTGSPELQLTNDWKNSGTFNPGMGMVSFYGNSANQVQTINSGIKNSETFYDLKINNSNGAIGINLPDGFNLTVVNNLSLINGDLRLTGEAQLVQLGNTANPSTGTGKILIDQQGQKNSYHYNYWCSPVTPGGTSYTIAGVLRDGTDSATNPYNPAAINFGDGAYFADGPLSSPIKISNRWLYKYSALAAAYSGWQYVGSTGSIGQAEGFIMKGSTGVAPLNGFQNYVFVGKPNNGILPVNLGSNQIYLVGNPYPSALDANEFIKDNIKDSGGRAVSNLINGAVYFWDHFGGASHYLSEYIGGYASYTLMGGVVAISNDPMINANGALGSKIPKRFIPVAQGFMISSYSPTNLTSNNPNLTTAITGGTIQFKNSQRTFSTESSGNSVFMRNQNTDNTTNSTDTRQRIRLQYESPTHLFRSLMAGADPNASNFFDIGYDAAMIDLNKDDLYWTLKNIKLVIQAVQNFDQEQILPLGITSSIEGLHTISISGLENLNDQTSVYLYDNVNQTYTDLKNENFSIYLPAGKYEEQFSIRFKKENILGLPQNEINKPIIYFTNNDETINVLNPNPSLRFKTVELYNILGQLVHTYKIETGSQSHIKIRTYQLPAGTYIIKSFTDNNLNFNSKFVKKY